MIPDPATRACITADEPFAELGIDRTTGYRAIKDGTFPVPVIRVGRLIRVPTAALRRLLDADGDLENSTVTDQYDDDPTTELPAPEQLRQFFAGIANHRLAAAYILAATTGMRRGEVLGIRWRDIDFCARRLHVQQTVLTVEYRIVIGRPKTLRGERKIALDDQTIQVLRNHRAAQRQEKQLLGDGYHDQGLVFAREDGAPVHPDYFSQTFDRTVKRLGLPKIRLHDLRHTHATLGRAAGVHVKVISDRLDHATTSFTQDVYMHAIPAVEEDAADQIAHIVFKGTSAPEQSDEATTGQGHASLAGGDAEGDNPSPDESYDESDGR